MDSREEARQTLFVAKGETYAIKGIGFAILVLAEAMELIAKAIAKSYSFQPTEGAIGDIYCRSCGLFQMGSLKQIEGRLIWHYQLCGNAQMKYNSNKALTDTP